MKKLAFCLLALTPAFAFAAPGPYATLQAGLNMVNASNSLQDDPIGFVGGGAVGYLWGDNTINYGLEADGLVYPNSNSGRGIGTTHDYQSSYDGYNLSLLAVLKYTSCSTGFTAFVKGGGAYVSQQVTFNTAGPLPFDAPIGTQTNQTDFAFEAAAGVGYFFTQNLEADITWDHVFADSQPRPNATGSNLNVVDNDNFLLGLTYHFA
jgi:opacity protein-like surface antigen